MTEGTQVCIMASYPPILAAEDEETDALLLEIALSATGLRNPLVLVRDGQIVLDYLCGKPPYQDRLLHPLPGLLLLDLKMPRMNGFDVMAWLLQRPEFQQLPVVVLSSSTNESDMRKATELGARDYLVKPNNFRDLTKMLQHVAARWLGDTARVATFEQAGHKHMAL